MNQNSVKKISVRKARPDDLQHVKDLYSRLTPDIAKVDRDFCRLLKDVNSMCLILEEGIPIGMITFFVRTSLSSGKKMVIDEIIVDINYRNKGYGRALMEYVISMAKDMNLDCVELACSETRQALHTFYEGMHFEHTMRLYHLYLGDEK